MRKKALIFLALLLTLMLVVSPMLSKGDKGGGNNNGGGNGGQSQQSHGNGNAGGNGNGTNGNGNAFGHDNNNGGGQTEQQPVVQPTVQPSDTTISAQTTSNVLGCQKNNPERLDCSSLEVRGYCDGTVAVFTIRNTGEAGNGDMRTATAYRVVVDGSVVQSGVVQITGGATMEVRYQGISGQTVTLEADQQIGHPGNSHPRVTLDCGGVPPTEEPTVEVTPTQEVTPEPTVEVTEESFVLVGDGYCKPEFVIFNVTNTGGAMPVPVGYVVYTGGGSVVSEGTLQLGAGESITLTESIFARMLNVGNGLLIITVDCAPATEEPTVEITDEPTEEWTPTPEPFNLVAEAMCDLGTGLVTFTITNVGGTMTSPMTYRLLTYQGMLVEEGQIYLGSGESTNIYADPGGYILNVGDGTVIQSIECVNPVPTDEVTPEPTEEVTVVPTDEPTEEWTPTPEPFNLIGDVTCDFNSGLITFTVTNTGGTMTSPLTYSLLTFQGTIVEEGEIYLGSGETINIYADAGAYILNVGGGILVQVIECNPPVVTEEPTVEVTPEPTQEVTPEPTVEVTPTEEVTPEPTVEVTPTEEVTPEPTVEVTPTPLPPLSCSKNNSARLDCSSLQVSATCVGDVAVFTIRNTGVKGNGDMRAPTEYRLIVNGVVIEVGTVDLDGAATMQVRYEGDGRVTLEADQQIGHPGNSQPQATISC